MHPIPSGWRGEQRHSQCNCWMLLKLVGSIIWFFIHYIFIVRRFCWFKSHCLMIHSQFYMSSMNRVAQNKRSQVPIKTLPRKRPKFGQNQDNPVLWLGRVAGHILFDLTALWLLWLRHDTSMAKVTVEAVINRAKRTNTPWRQTSFL